MVEFNLSVPGRIKHVFNFKSSKLDLLISKMFLARLFALASLSAVFSPHAIAEMAGGFTKIYSDKTCLRNEIPVRCDVYYSPKDVTWRVHWKDTGLVDYYLRRGGKWFEIRNSHGDGIGAAELMPDRQVLRLTRKGGSTAGTIKIFDLD
jgi:hypothetical protein